MFHPLSSELSKRERLEAFVASFALAILFGGLCHLACAVLFRNYKHIPPGTQTPATVVFQRTVMPGGITLYDVPSTSKTPVYYKESKLETGETVRHFRTMGGGSCAFHALFGEWNGEMYAHQELQALRDEFVDYLRQLKDRPKDIPSAFDVYCGEQEIPIDDPASFEKYLEYLRKPETYLLQDELIALADWQKISVQLIQREWGQEDKIVSSTLNDGGDDHVKTITIYYSGPSNGGDHYERAEIVDRSHTDR